MRSRFAAYALGEAEYLWRTLHDDHADRRRPEEDVLRDVRESARALRYLRLTILEAKEERVLFVAKVFQNGVDRSFIELSTFAREGSSWRYREGVARGLAGSSTTDWTIDSFEAATAGGS
jgi:SEC-C motif-containing protein